jgi:hypothetical protein
MFLNNRNGTEFEKRMNDDERPIRWHHRKGDTKSSSWSNERKAKQTDTQSERSAYPGIFNLLRRRNRSSGEGGLEPNVIILPTCDSLVHWFYVMKEKSIAGAAGARSTGIERTDTPADHLRDVRNERTAGPLEKNPTTRDEIPTTRISPHNEHVKMDAGCWMLGLSSFCSFADLSLPLACITSLSVLY